MMPDTDAARTGSPPKRCPHHPLPRHRVFLFACRILYIAAPDASQSFFTGIAHPVMTAEYRSDLNREKRSRGTAEKKLHTIIEIRMREMYFYGCRCFILMYASMRRAQLTIQRKLHEF
jgi:hypothetical protein